MRYDGIVIGGGASGFAAAVTALERGKKVLLLEREEKAGSKILVTGNGKCNLSAVDVCPEKYNDPAFVTSVIGEDVTAFWQKVGILTKVMNGKVYPYSETALTVVNALRKKVGDALVCGVEVNDVQAESGGR